VGRSNTLKRRWRFYANPAGKKPVKEFIGGLTDADAASVVAAMLDVRKAGLVAARHLRGDLYEVRAQGAHGSYRVLFAEEGAKGRVLLAVHAVSKKMQKTPAKEVELAERRLADWRHRASR